METPGLVVQQATSLAEGENGAETEATTGVEGEVIREAAGDMARKTSTFAEPTERESLTAEAGLISGGVRDSMMKAEYNVANKKWKNYAKAKKVAAIFNKLLVSIMTRQPDNVHKFLEIALTIDADIAVAVEKHNAGLHEEAAAAFEGVREHVEIVYGPRHDKMGMVLMSLANAKEEVHEQAEAVKLYEETLSILRESTTVDHNAVISVLNQLAALHITMHNFDLSIPPLEEALAAVREVGGDEDTAENEGDVLANMGVAKKELGDHAGASMALEEAASLFEQAGVVGEKLADVHNNLAEVFESMDNYSKAKGAYERSIEIREESLVPGHRSTIDTINLLAMLEYHNEKFEPAFGHAMRAMDMMEEAHDNLDRKPRLDAEEIFKTGNHNAAMALAQKALRSYRKQIRHVTRSVSRSFRSDATSVMIETGDAVAAVEAVPESVREGEVDSARDS